MERFRSHFLSRCPRPVASGKEKDACRRTVSHSQLPHQASFVLLLFHGLGSGESALEISLGESVLIAQFFKVCQPALQGFLVWFLC